MDQKYYTCKGDYMSDYLDELNFSWGEVKDYFRLAIKKEEFSNFFRREIIL